MKKTLLALAVLMFAGLFWAQPAEARCWWNGFRTVCTHHHYWRHHWWYGYYHPYRYYYRPYYYGYYRPYYYRPHICTPWPLCWG